jgi:hypothetical protein
MDNLTSSVLQLRILDEVEDTQMKSHAQSRQPKHSPLVMTPGGSFTKAKGRSFNSPGDEGDDMEEGDDEDDDETKISRAAAIAASREAGNPIQSGLEISQDAQEQQQQQARQVGLFGGAISIILPNAFDDISTIRQVPDHQEVFVDRNSEISFIVELVNFDSDVSDANAPGHYFSDLAECNEAKNVKIDSSGIVSVRGFMPLLTEKSVVKCAIAGRQTVSKFRREDAPLEIVQILLVIVRLPHVGTDILISVNVPFVESLAPIKIEDLFDLRTQAHPATRVMAAALHSLHVRNWSLFA